MTEAGKDELLKRLLAGFSDWLSRLEELAAEAPSFDREELSRLLHNMKGASASVGLSSLEDCIHEMEDRIGEVAPERLGEVLFEYADRLRRLLLKVEEDRFGEVDAERGRESVRVSLRRIDELVELSGELVVFQERFSSMMEQLERLYCEVRNSGGPCGGETLVDALLSLRNTGRSLRIRSGALIERLNGRLVRLRMVPAGRLLRKTAGMARSLASRLGRKVRVVVEGEDVLLERIVLEEMEAPLTHLVRNALDHGIESPEERRKAGKPAEGTLKLRAEGESRSVSLVVEDDGRGIDVEAVLEKARRLGLLDGGREYETLRGDEALKFIFSGGFSTRDEVGTVSGRGIGLDVVEYAVRKLGGDVSVVTEKGCGTQFRLSLPLNMSVVPSLVLPWGEGRYAVAERAVLQIEQVSLDEVVVVDREVRIRRGGALVPALYIASLFPALGDGCVAVPRRLYALSFRMREHVWALLVPELGETHKLYVRRLELPPDAPRFVAGGAILPDGRVALLLDPVDLFMSWRQGTFASVPPPAVEPSRPPSCGVTEEEPPPDRLFVLVSPCFLRRQAMRLAVENSRSASRAAGAGPVIVEAPSAERLRACLDSSDAEGGGVLLLDESALRRDGWEELEALLERAEAGGWRIGRFSFGGEREG